MRRTSHQPANAIGRPALHCQSACLSASHCACRLFWLAAICAAVAGAIGCSAFSDASSTTPSRLTWQPPAITPTAFNSTSAPQSGVVAASWNSPAVSQRPGSLFGPPSAPQNGATDPSSANFRDMTLLEVLQIALQNSQVLRDLGGRVVSQPGRVNTAFAPDLVFSDARSGVEAALSSFDAQLTSSAIWARNNRGLKLVPPGSSNISIEQDTYQQRTSIDKRLRNGAVLSYQHGMDYDRDDLGVPPNRFESAYTPFVGAQLRIPLGYGRGRLFNEVAGPGARPGVYNGLLIASTRADLAATDYQIGLRDFVYNVARNYWLLQFAYRRFEAVVRKEELARQLVQAAEAKEREGLGDPDAIDVAKQALVAAELDVQDVFSGPPERIISGILGPNGALLAGSELGVLPLERRLRFLMGLPAVGNFMIRPLEQPTDVSLIFDWHSTQGTAFARRPEIARQQRVVQQRQLELMASKLTLQPTVDVISQVRVLGFGDELFGNNTQPQSSAIAELLGQELKEFAAGVEIQWPYGNRIGRTAVTNAQVALARESAVLEQQFLQISHETASAIEEVQRALKAIELNRKRVELVRRRLASYNRKFELGITTPVEVGIRLTQEQVDAQTLLELSKMDYQIAIIALGLARGTLMEDLAIGVLDSQAAPRMIGATTPQPYSAAPATPHVLSPQVPRPPVSARQLFGSDSQQPQVPVPGASWPVSHAGGGGSWQGIPTTTVEAASATNSADLGDRSEQSPPVAKFKLLPPVLEEVSDPPLGRFGLPSPSE